MCLAVPGKIIQISGDNDLSRMGKIDFAGIQKDISLAYLPEANINDYVIVHAGFAIALIDQQEALETLKAFQELENFETSL